MRWYILKALLHKEAMRHLVNRAGLALALMLVVAALLLSIFKPGQGESSTGLIGGVHHCFLEHPNYESAWVKHLRKNMPREMDGRIVFRRMPAAQVGSGAIRVREVGGEPGAYSVDLLYPQGQPDSLAPYERWFWAETRKFFESEATAGRPELAAKLSSPVMKSDLWTVTEAFERFRDQVEVAQSDTPRYVVPRLIIAREEVKTSSVLDVKVAVGMALVVFSLFVSCVYLLPAFTCEERERGVLLAQALSPASPVEILAAKFLFYPVAGMGLAAVLTAIYKPVVLTSVFFWLSLLTVSLGFLGIGMVVACLAKTQRAASMGALTYALCVTMILFICQQGNIPFLPQLALEYHGPKILHAALEQNIQWFHWAHLMAAFCLATGWCAAAAILFRRRGWQ